MQLRMPGTHLVGEGKRLTSEQFVDFLASQKIV